MGLFAPTYSLRSQKDLGAGGFHELSRLVDFVQKSGGQVVGTLPLMASFLDELFQPSPYVPVSKLFWNEMFLDLESIAYIQNSAAAKAKLESLELKAEATRLKTLAHVDYKAYAKLHRSVLEILAQEAFETNSTIRAEIESRIATHPRLADYARFRAVTETLRASWHTWPDRMRDGNIQEGDYNPSSFRYHVYAQYWAEKQLGELGERARAAGAGLYLDLPLGVHPDGYDAWREKSCFLGGVSTGAPPDGLAPEGQDWGFRPLHPESIRQDRYRYFIDSVRQQIKNAGVLRIDHVMGMHRVYCVPWEIGAREGIYVKYRADEIWAILTLESARHKTMLVGEDLGTVPPEVREAMQRHDVQRMYVMQFEMRHERHQAVTAPFANSVASMNTHDTPTFAGFWNEQDIGDRLSLGHMTQQQADWARGERGSLRRSVAGYLQDKAYSEPNADQNNPDQANVYAGATRFLAQSASRMALYNIEDLWLETEPQNVPGTSHERPNWQRKVALNLEEVEAMPKVKDILAKVSTDRRNS